MEILEVNRNTLANLYEQYPDSFKDLSIDGKFLVYSGQIVDISEFNINDLLGGETAFASSLNGLSSEDIFKIIRLHATFLKSLNKDVDKNENNNDKKLEAIKQENPLMQNISIIKKNDGVVTTEYFNIVDSNGDDHLFVNDRKVDIFSIYEEEKIRSNGEVTPDELIEAINRKLYTVRLDNASNLAESDEVSEDFANKMNRVNDPYRSDKSIKVYGNEKNDIAVVADDRDVQEHKVVTFNKNEFGDLVTESHHQNVSGDEITTDNSSETTSTSVDDYSDEQITQKKEEEIVERLISEEEFYHLLNSELDLTADERKSVDLFYGYLGDLVLYEAYLLPALMDVLNRFRAYVYGLQYERDETQDLNNKQQEAIEKAEEFEVQKNETELSKDPNKVKEEVQKLQLKYNPSDAENRGTISILAVIIAIIFVTIIMTIITFNIIY